ncbi:MAG: hypothetical protein LBD02_00680 [Christensenellaceae bacterium]|nr:hypothetical protein [Christensenellaceae bacterium]
MGKNRFVRLTAIVLTMCVLCVAPASAATGAQGYAVFRDGVFTTYVWHAGMMYTSTSASYSVIQASGSGKTVGLVTWSTFMNSGSASNTFKGVYRPNQFISSLTRDNAAAMANQLKNLSLPYCLAQILQYSAPVSNTWVGITNLIAMRCDGVVEWCYEYLGYTIYGGTDWDISRNLPQNQVAHLTEMPQTQAGVMTKVQSSIP